MNLRYEILRAVSRNPGAPVEEICDAIDNDARKTKLSVLECRKKGLLSIRRDFTGRPGYLLTAEGKSRLALGPGKPSNGSKPQPEVGENTGSDGSGLSGSMDSTEAVAVQESAPEPCANTVTAARDDEMYLRNVFADIRKAVGDNGGLTAEGIVECVRQLRADANELYAARKVLGEHDDLLKDRGELASVHDILAQAVGRDDHVDPSDRTTVELARTVTAEHANARALVAKLEHLLASKTHECEALRASIPATAEHSDQKGRSKYHREITRGTFVDVYDVLNAFKVTNPALQHLVKKALAPGQRGHKDRAQDLEEIVVSAIRARELG